MKRARTSLLAVVMALSLAPPARSEPQPPAGAVPEPAASTLPEIGRTRATRATCAVLRDLVEPSLAAARRGNERFADTRPLVAKYVKKLDDKDDIGRSMLLMRIDRGYMALADQSIAISRALGDPRIPDGVTDPELLALRKALQVLYDNEAAQTNMLAVWVMKARFDYMLGGLHGSDESTVARRTDPFAAGDPNPLYVPPAPGSLQGGLTLTGDGLADARRSNEATGELAAAVTAREAFAARAIAAVTDGCPPKR